MSSLQQLAELAVHVNPAVATLPCAFLANKLPFLSGLLANPAALATQMPAVSAATAAAITAAAVGLAPNSLSTATAAAVAALSPPAAATAQMSPPGSTSAQLPAALFNGLQFPVKSESQSFMFWMMLVFQLLVFFDNCLRRRTHNSTVVPCFDLTNEPVSHVASYLAKLKIVFWVFCWNIFID